MEHTDTPSKPLNPIHLPIWQAVDRAFTDKVTTALQLAEFGRELRDNDHVQVELSPGDGTRYRVIMVRQRGWRERPNGQNRVDLAFPNQGATGAAVEGYLVHEDPDVAWEALAYATNMREYDAMMFSRIVDGVVFVANRKG